MVGFVQAGGLWTGNDGVMTTATLFPSATTTVADVIRGIDGLDLSTATPCTDFDAAALINHFTGTVGSLGRIGRGEPLDPENPWGRGQHTTEPGWPDRLATLIDELGAAWAGPDAWQGSVSFGSSEMPAESVGQMAFGEALLHGWDLARTADRSLTVSDEVGAELLQFIVDSADLGRSMGAYGPEVAVAQDRPAIDRALGLSGRDPDWRSA